MIKAIATAFALICCSPATPDDIVLASRLSNAAQMLMSMECSILSTADARTAVSDVFYLESKSLYFRSRSLLAKHGHVALPEPVASRRRYRTRKTLSVAMAAKLTGLGESTIKRLDNDPKNTNYPGRNVNAKMLVAWARIYRENKLAASEVRAANRPRYGYGRS